jgi:hypothetical protein
MKVPWKIVGLAGIAGVTAATGVVVARKRREHTDYNPDELRDKLHTRVAEATESDVPLAEADTKIHTSPHGDKAAEGAPAESAPATEPAAESAPATEPAAESAPATEPAAESAPATPGGPEGDGAPHTSSAS